MAKYLYTAESSLGELESGELEADSEAAARRQLDERGWATILLVPASDVDESIVLEAGVALTDDQVLSLAQAMETAAKIRVPLEVTLSALTEERDDARLARVAGQLADELSRGVTIGAAMDRLGGRLPAELREVLQAGVECGDLAGTIERFAQQRAAAQRAHRRIRSAVAYPLVIVAILVPLTLFLAWYVIPMFEDLYGEFGLDLPGITRILLDEAHVVPWIILALVALSIVLPIVARLPGGRWLWHRLRGALPGLGKLWIWSGQREFADMLASFLQLRLPLDSALAHTSNIISDRNLGSACHAASERLALGEPLGRSLSESIHFDRSLVALVTWGEEHGLLPESLRLATKVFDDRIEQYMSLVRRLVPPVTMVVVASLALIVVLSLMIPLVKLIEGLSG